MSESNADIMRRAHNLTIEIYPKILCITRDPDGTKNITVASDKFDFIPWAITSRRNLLITSTLNLQYRIVLSCELLTWMTMDGRIPLSFINFITTQELSGPFYIQPGYLPYPNYRIFTADTSYVSSLPLLSSSKIFLIVMLDLSHFLVPSN